MRCIACGHVRSDGVEKCNGAGCDSFVAAEVQGVYGGDYIVAGTLEAVREKLIGFWGEARVREEDRPADTPEDLTPERFPRVLRVYIGPKFDSLDRIFARKKRLDERRKRLAARRDQAEKEFEK